MITLLVVHNVSVALPAAEDPCGGGHVQGGGGRHPPAGVRAQSRRAGGSDPDASDWRRHPPQRSPEHDLNNRATKPCAVQEVKLYHRI